MIKVGLILGIAGACRTDELVNLTVDDIEDVGSSLIVKIPNTKRSQANAFENNFGLKNLADVEGDRTESPKHRLLAKELLTRNIDTPYHVNNNQMFLRKVSEIDRAVYGKNNAILKWQHSGTSKWADLKLLNIAFMSILTAGKLVSLNNVSKVYKVWNVELRLNYLCCGYTGHCLRRSSATLLADAGVDITTIKRHAGWKSTTVAQGYVENSIENKTKIANQVLKLISIPDRGKSNNYIGECIIYFLGQSLHLARISILTRINIYINTLSSSRAHFNSATFFTLLQKRAAYRRL
ncbi:hypothetical protein NQ317_007591 [Molorchus minor]|uniref:Tyr recombinase domain-containing protein n=1 Tax=Molorchus minor TaxID=1323400 RepID=A0ABQ9JEC6_9CUCU|nr:hypothetical protein NQ317_007591 [Molorchus minor]